MVWRSIFCVELLICSISFARLARNLLSRFFRSMNDLSLNPEAPEVRSAAIESGLSLAQTFNMVGDQLRTLRSDLNGQASRLVDEVNRMTNEISGLNRRIAVSEVGGTVNANDLRDQRDLLLSQLSEIIPITTEEQANGAIDVNLAGERIVDGVNHREILKESTASPDGLEIFRLRVGETGLDAAHDDAAGAFDRGHRVGAVDAAAFADQHDVVDGAGLVGEDPGGDLGGTGADAVGRRLDAELGLGGAQLHRAAALQVERLHRRGAGGDGDTHGKGGLELGNHHVSPRQSYCWQGE